MINSANVCKIEDVSSFLSYVERNREKFGDCLYVEERCNIIWQKYNEAIEWLSQRKSQIFQEEKRLDNRIFEKIWNKDDIDLLMMRHWVNQAWIKSSFWEIAVLWKYSIPINPFLLKDLITTEDNDEFDRRLKNLDFSRIRWKWLWKTYNEAADMGVVFWSKSSDPKILLIKRLKDQKLATPWWMVDSWEESEFTALRELFEEVPWIMKIFKMQSMFSDIEFDETESIDELVTQVLRRIWNVAVTYSWDALDPRSTPFSWVETFIHSLGIDFVLEKGGIDTIEINKKEVESLHLISLNEFFKMPKEDFFAWHYIHIWELLISHYLENQAQKVKEILTLDDGVFIKKIRDIALKERILLLLHD